MQEELGLNMYDYGNRNYDSTIGRFHNMDRFSEKYLDNSPYHYTKNNPVFFIDVKGDSLAVFRPNGSYWKTIDDGKKSWSGRFYQKSKVTGTKVDGNTTYTYYEYSDALDFNFADPENDTKDIENTVLISVDEKKIANMLGEVGAFNPDNKGSFDFLNKHSKGGQKLDFTYSSIPFHFPQVSSSTVLFLPKGDKLAHNHSNFGNYLWGAAGWTLGFAKATLLLGAHYNSLSNSDTNGYDAQFDSSDDQKSIEAGINYSINHYFYSRQWNGSEISPMPKKRK